MSAIINLKYFNSFWLKKINSIVAADPVVEANVPGGYANDVSKDWFIEESRIRGGYNNTSVDLGVKAYIVEKENKQQHRFNSIIYSGVFNSRTGINNTNVFSVSEDITKSTDPANGSIQKLYAEDTNLVILQEDKVSRALIDKDAIYSAEGGSITTAGSQVIGQVIPFLGNYGISNNPESFTVYGYRKYFTDRKRNAVLRLSRDGITEISSYGMRDFFRDELGSTQATDNIVGGWDIHNGNYVVSIHKPNYYSTLCFDENAKGWVSFFTYKPNYVLSLNSTMYSITGSDIYRHYAYEDGSIGVNGIFYGVRNNASVEFVFNSQSSAVKNFKTINYEGDTGWEVVSFSTISDQALPIYKATDWSSGAPRSLADMQNQLFNNNFKRKEDKYFANIVNNTPVSAGVINMGDNTSGVKGFFAKVEMTIDKDLPGTHELFAVSTNYSESSY
jgi:hypothetical protein